MIGASKILTVSYGTFSCTLEGFDDSFGTMKAIAEYFRDLAADDRYFGAEPPTPDADMLAKIAGREIKRQVEAKVEESGVTLRPIEQSADIAAPVEEISAPVAPTPEPQPAPVAEAPVVVEAPVDEPAIEEAPAAAAETLVIPTTEYDDAQDDAQVEVVEDDTNIEPDTESVAAKLRRIRAVVAKNQAAGATASIFAEEEHAEEFVSDVVEAPAEEAEAEADAAPEEVAEDSNDLDAMMGRITEDAAEEVDEAAKEASETLDEAPEAEEEILVEAEIEVEVEVETEVEIEAEVETETEAAIEAEAEETIEEEVSVAGILDAVTEDDASDDMSGDKDQSSDEEMSAEPVFEADAEDHQNEAAEADQNEADQDEAPAEVADAEDVNEEDENDNTEEMVRLVRPTRARVIKMKKAEYEEEATAASDEDASENFDHDRVEYDIQEDVQDTLGETSLSAEDEADLVAELADVELEDTPAIDDGIDAALRAERASRALHDEGGAEDEAAVSRLLDETNAQLGTTESTRRRSAISHLRAAVAATVADRKFNPLKRDQPKDDAEQYRTDLADVVQPNRPEAGSGSHTDRPAPLILVSEQRIDEDDADAQAPAAVIQPRRVSRAAALREVETEAHNLDDLSPAESGNGDDEGANIFADSTSFADFAEKMGATELPDLLEAAAAYTAYVEGRPHFARPQIMRQVANFAGKKEFNREEGLRSFGQLLRQGKIIKVKRGQFEIADSTRFKPEARYAGE